MQSFSYDMLFQRQFNIYNLEASKGTSIKQSKWISMQQCMVPKALFMSSSHLSTSNLTLIPQAKTPHTYDNFSTMTWCPISSWKGFVIKILKTNCIRHANAWAFDYMHACKNICMYRCASMQIYVCAALLWLSDTWMKKLEC